MHNRHNTTDEIFFFASCFHFRFVAVRPALTALSHSSHRWTGSTHQQLRVDMTEAMCDECGPEVWPQQIGTPDILSDVTVGRLLFFLFLLADDDQLFLFLLKSLFWCSQLTCASPKWVERIELHLRAFDGEDGSGPAVKLLQLVGPIARPFSSVQNGSG